MLKIKLLLIALIFVRIIYPQTIPLTISSKGYIFADVVFNDSVKAAFLFDTGGGLMLINSSVFGLIKQSVRDEGVFTGFRHNGERLDMELFGVPRINFAGRNLNNVTAAVFPLLDEYGIDGVISLKEIENTPATINFKDKTLTFETEASLREIEISAVSIPVKLHNQIDRSLDMFITLCINDSVKIDAEFDTGSGFGGLFINPYYAGKLGLDTASALNKSYNMIPGGNTSVDYELSLNKIMVCGLNDPFLSDVKATFRQGLIYQGLIGSEIFKNSIVTIDIPRSRMLIR